MTRLAHQRPVERGKRKDISLGHSRAPVILPRPTPEELPLTRRDDGSLVKGEERQRFQPGLPRRSWPGSAA